MVNYSAADLIKKSARQLVFLRNQRQRITTAMQARGLEFQSKVSQLFKEKNKDSYAEELRGVYQDTDNDFCIFFCVDMFSNEEFYEIKAILDKDGNVTDKYEEWYWFNSLLQVAFYKALLISGNNDTLYTPKFRLKEGFKFQSQKVNVNNNYYLIFGEKKVIVDITDPKPIIEHYTRKILSLTDYGTAGEWDAEHKFKDYEELKQYLFISRVQEFSKTF